MGDNKSHLELVSTDDGIEGILREADAKIWCLENGYKFRGWDGNFCYFTDHVGDSMESWIPRKESAPLPDMPGVGDG